MALFVIVAGTWLQLMCFVTSANVFLLLPKVVWGFRLLWTLLQNQRTWAPEIRNESWARWVVLVVLIVLISLQFIIIYSRNKWFQKRPSYGRHVSADPGVRYLFSFFKWDLLGIFFIFSPLFSIFFGVSQKNRAHLRRSTVSRNKAAWSCHTRVAAWVLVDDFWAGICSSFCLSLCRFRFFISTITETFSCVWRGIDTVSLSILPVGLLFSI